MTDMWPDNVQNTFCFSRSGINTHNDIIHSKLEVQPQVAQTSASTFFSTSTKVHAGILKPLHPGEDNKAQEIKKKMS